MPCAQLYLPTATLNSVHPQAGVVGGIHLIDNTDVKLKFGLPPPLQPGCIIVDLTAADLYPVAYLECYFNVRCYIWRKYDMN